METKKLCPIHYFKYVGHTCPICDKERIERMEARIEKRHQKAEAEPQPQEETHYTMDDLMAKFNSR